MIFWLGEYLKSLYTKLIITLKIYFIIEIRVHLALKEFLKSFDLITGYFTQQKLINILEVNMRSHLYDVFLPFFCVVYSLLACVFVQLSDLRYPIKITRFDVLIVQNVNEKAKQTSHLPLILIKELRC